MRLRESLDQLLLAHGGGGLDPLLLRALPQLVDLQVAQLGLADVRRPGRLVPRLLPAHRLLQVRAASRRSQRTPYPRAARSSVRVSARSRARSTAGVAGRPAPCYAAAFCCAAMETIGVVSLRLSASKTVAAFASSHSTTEPAPERR